MGSLLCQGAVQRLMTATQALVGVYRALELHRGCRGQGWHGFPCLANVVHQAVDLIDGSDVGVHVGMQYAACAVHVQLMEVGGQLAAFVVV